MLNTYKHHHTETYLLYLCPCLDLGLFMSNLCDLSFTFIFSFIMINHVISWVKTSFLFVCFSEYVISFLDHNVEKECEQFFQIFTNSASDCCLAFGLFFANLSLDLLIKKARIAITILKFVNKVVAKIYRNKVLEFKQIT